MKHKTGDIVTVTFASDMVKRVALIVELVDEMCYGENYRLLMGDGSLKVVGSIHLGNPFHKKLSARFRSA